MIEKVPINIADKLDHKWNTQAVTHPNLLLF